MSLRLSLVQRSLAAGARLCILITLLGALLAGIALPGLVSLLVVTDRGAEGTRRLPLMLLDPAPAQRSRVLMANGQTLANFYDENRVYVPLSRIAPVMRQAQIGIEDHEFYQHGAIYLRGTLRAFVRNGSGGSTQGGSSITQQYVKMTLIQQAQAQNDQAGVEAAQEASYPRKVRELRYALAVEQRLTKDQILERYLNIAYYGDGVYGVEQAARHYFGVSASRLDLAQAAMLAGLVQNPVGTNPHYFPQRALARRDVVISRMVNLGWVSFDQARRARREPWRPHRMQDERTGCLGTRFPFLCDYVRRSLLTDPALGTTPTERQRRLQRGGLTIRTRIVPDTQRHVERVVSRLVAPRDPVIATMTLIDPHTGLIKAMAQSRPVMGVGRGQTFYDYPASSDMGGAEGFQAGSTFKTFTAAAAIEAGIAPTRRYDAPARMDFSGQPFESCDGTLQVPAGYRPKNSTRSGSRMDMEMATRWSVNTYYLQLGRDTGLCRVATMGQRLGVQLASGAPLRSQSHVFSLPLGPVDVTPLSMTEAYATLANDGVRCRPQIIDRVTDAQGRGVKVAGRECHRVVSSDVARSVTSLLQGVMTSGTGRPARPDLTRDLAGKTGATDHSQAAWFCGYSPELAGCASIAVDKADRRWSGRIQSLTGLALAHGTTLTGDGSGDAGAGLWRPAMEYALQQVPPTPFPHRVTREQRGFR